MLICLQWNKTLQSIDSSADSITAHFEDGSSYTGRLLVASDGARSVARQILYPDGCQMNSLPVQLLGASTLYTAEEMGGAQAIDPYIFQGSHPDTNVFLFFSCMLSLGTLVDQLSNKSQSWIRPTTSTKAARTSTMSRSLSHGPMKKILPCLKTTSIVSH